LLFYFRCSFRKLEAYATTKSTARGLGSGGEMEMGEVNS